MSTISSISAGTNNANKALFATAGSSSNSATFLNSTDVSPVQKMLDAEKTKAAASDANNYFYSENYLKLKAFEIRSRIVLYQNMGLSAQYQQAQQEGQLVVQEYQAYLKAATAAGGDEDGGAAAGAAAARVVGQRAQATSNAYSPSLLTVFA